MAEGEFALVRENLEMGLSKMASWVGDHDLYAMLADAAAQQRDEAALRRYAPLAEETAVRYKHILYQAIAQRAWGVAHRLAGDYAEAETSFNRALQFFEALGTRWQIGRTLMELAELAQAQADSTRARSCFSSAALEFESLDAKPDAARARTALSALTPGT